MSSAAVQQPPATSEARELAAASPASMAHVCSGGRWVPYEHLILLNDYLLRLEAGEIDRLIVTMPPQHGKSELISHWLPAWYLGTHPKRKVLLGSYQARYAHSWGRKARECLHEFGPWIWGVDVAEEPRGVDWWFTAEGGYMASDGLGGPFTGKGAHLLIIDDPIKGHEDANSEVMREKAWDWWVATLASRLQAHNAVVVVQTRWHEDDLAGRLLLHETDEWTVLNLPALAEENDPLGRAEGEPLCAELHSAAKLERQRRKSAYWWASMYQQRPAPLEGFLFKRRDFRYFTEDVEADLYVMVGAQGEPDRPVGRGFCYRFVTCDPAFSEKQTADYTAIGLWAVTPWKDLLLLDVERVRFDVENVSAAIHRHYELHRPNDLRVASKAYGTRIINELVQLGLPVMPVEEDTDKVTRALSAVPRYEAHAVFHRAGADYVEPYERELLAFPNATNDDQVDMYSFAALALPELQLVAVRQESMGTTETGGLATQQL